MTIDTIAFIFKCLIAGGLIFWIGRSLWKERNKRKPYHQYFSSKYNYRNPE